ncbi:hypothetical protein Pelo_16090 [Pelomyxa schiedti]|nr:hypothetical protein Pelo_16090 [Pelomyxa schiedti]
MGLCRRLSGLSSTSRHRAADAQMLIELATAIQLLLWPHYIILPSSSTDNSIALPILLGSWCPCLGGSRNFTLTHWFAGERIMFFLHAVLSKIQSNKILTIVTANIILSASEEHSRAANPRGSLAMGWSLPTLARGRVDGALSRGKAPRWDSADASLALSHFLLVDFTSSGF